MNEERRMQNAERRVLTFLQKSLNEIMTRLVDHQKTSEAKKDFKRANDIRQFRYLTNNEPKKWSSYNTFMTGDLTQKEFDQFINTLKEKGIEFYYLEENVQDVNSDTLFPDTIFLVANKDKKKFYQTIEEWNHKEDRPFDVEHDDDEKKQDKEAKNDDVKEHDDEENADDVDKKDKKKQGKGKADKEEPVPPVPKEESQDNIQHTDDKIETGKKSANENDDISSNNENEIERTENETIEPISPAIEAKSEDAKKDHFQHSSEEPDLQEESDNTSSSEIISETPSFTDTTYEDQEIERTDTEDIDLTNEQISANSSHIHTDAASEKTEDLSDTDKNIHDHLSQEHDEQTPVVIIPTSKTTDAEVHTTESSISPSDISNLDITEDVFFSRDQSSVQRNEAIHQEEARQQEKQQYQQEEIKKEEQTRHEESFLHNGSTSSDFENKANPSKSQFVESTVNEKNTVHISFTSHNEPQSSSSQQKVESFFENNATVKEKERPSVTDTYKVGGQTEFDIKNDFTQTSSVNTGTRPSFVNPVTEKKASENQYTGSYQKAQAYGQNINNDSHKQENRNAFYDASNKDEAELKTPFTESSKISAKQIDLSSYNARSYNKSFREAVWNMTGAKQAMEEGGDNALHTYHSQVQQSGLGDLGMMIESFGDASFYTSEGRSIEKIFSKTVDGVGKNDLDLFQKIAGNKLGNKSLVFDTEESAKSSMSALAEMYSKNYLVKQKGKVQYSFAGKMASDESIEALYITLGGNSKVRVGNKVITTRENIINTLRLEARKKGIAVTEDDLERIADKMLKSAKHVTHSANHAARARFNMSNLVGKQIVKATQDDSTSQELRRLNQTGRTLRQTQKIFYNVQNIQTEHKIQRLTKQIGKQSERLEKLKNTNVEKYKKIYNQRKQAQDQIRSLTRRKELTDKKLERFKRENSLTNKAYQRIQSKVKSTKAYRTLSTAKQRAANTRLGKAVTKINTSVKKVVGKPLSWIAKAQEALFALLKKAFLVFLDVALVFVVIVVAFSIGFVMVLACLLLVLDFFIAPDDSFDPQKVEDSVMGKVYYELEYDETKWIQTLVTGGFMDKDYPPYIDQLTYTDTENMTDLRDMSAEEYVTNVLHMTYDKKKGAVLGPEPFPNAPSDAYKWVSLIDGGIEIEFRGRDGSYGYTSNIKEITSMTMSANLSTSAPELDYTEDDLDKNANDNDSPVAKIGGFFTNTVNAIRKAVKVVGNVVHNVATHIGAGIPGLADWWVANQANHRAKIFMQYAKPLFDLSHDQAYGLEMITYPTLWTANGSQPYMVNYGSSSINNTLGAPGENISGYQIDGTAIEVWMLSMAGETSCNFSMVSGDRGQAYGIMQFDYRYDLISFLNFAYKRNPTVWEGVKPFLNYKPRNIKLVNNSALKAAFRKARDTNYDVYVADQCIYMRNRYLTGGVAGGTDYVSQMRAKGIDLSQRNIAVSAAMLSVAVNQPASVRKFVLKANASMTDEQLIDLLYDNANAKKLARFTNSSCERQEAKDLLTGRLNVSRSASYGSGIVWNGRGQSYGPFFSSQANADAHYNGTGATNENANTNNTGNNTGSTTETATATNATFNIQNMNICNSDESQSQPVSSHNENGGYGCMSYNKFYYNDTDRTHLYYNGNMVAEAAPASVLGRDIPCNAPADAFFDEALEAHPECWAINVGGESGDLRGSGPSGGTSSYVDANYNEGYGFSGPNSSDGGHTYTAHITTDEWEENEGDSEDPDYVTYHRERTVTFTHNCAHNHTGYYCGGHLVLKVTGIITNITKAERENDHKAYQDKMKTKSWKHARNFVEPEASEVSDAKDLFDLDLAITHKDGTFSKDFIGWNYDNIDVVTTRLLDDWKELYNIEPVKSLDSIVGNLAANSGVSFISNLNIAALGGDSSGEIKEEDLKKDPKFAKIVEITKAKYSGASRSVYSQAGHQGEADRIVAKVHNNGQLVSRTGGRTADGKYGFDCSGFVGTILKEAGITDAFYGKTTASPGPGMKITDQSKIKPGDLMYFTGHVGIYCGNGVLLDCGGRSIKNGTYKQGYVRFIKLSQWHSEHFRYILRVYQ